ncbi:hypothetical protein Tco_0382810 [Tanacetum coccineum]
MPTEMELTLEQTQQGVSYEVSAVMDPVTLCTTLPSHSRFDISAGNPVKEILLKLNLLDHRIFKDGGEGCSRLHSSQDKGTSSHQKSIITTSNHKLMIEVNDYELKTEVKV